MANEENGRSSGKSLVEYDLLNILDGKAAALLGFNAIFLAALSVWLGQIQPNVMHFLLDLVFVLFLVACHLLLGVINLRWLLSADVPDTDGVRARRTKTYRNAWLLVRALVLIVLVISTIHAVGTFLQAFNLCGEAYMDIFGPEGPFGNFDYVKVQPN